MANSPVLILLKTLTTNIVKTNQASALNKMATMGSLCFLCGLLIVSYFAEHWEFHGLIIIYLISFSSNIVSICMYVKNKILNINTLFNLGLVQCLPDEIKKDQNEEVAKPFSVIVRSTASSLKQIPLSRKYRDIFVMKACMDFSYGIIMTNLGFIFRQVYYLHEQEISIIMIVFGAFNIVTNLCLVKLNKSWKYSDTSKGIRKALVGALVMALCYLLLSFLDIVGYILIALIIVIMARTFLDSTITEALLFRTENNNKGIIFSTAENVYLMFDIICPIASSFFIEMYGYQSNYIISSFTIFCGSILFYFYKRNNVTKNPTD